MKELRPFTPLGQTNVFTAATPTAPAGVQALKADIHQHRAAGSYRIVNTGTVAVWLGVGATAAEATANAVAASSGSPSDAILLLAGAAEIFSFGEEAYFSGLSASGTADVAVVQGIGD